jgi:Animal haem peroxidase
VDLDEDDPWTQERPMQIMRTRKDPTHLPEDPSPPTYLNTETHWWDGSQLYGSDREAQARVRSGESGKLRLTPDGSLPDDLQQSLAAQPGWWVGLALLYTLFAREHNAICDHLRQAYPSWSDDDLFDRARLVNVALMAKIHTVEWTPAIIAHPATRFAMRGNWWGLEGERLSRLAGRLADSEVLSGIPGSPTDHHGAPYAITEEFVAVYRMHPLIPDDYRFRAAAGDRLLQERPFNRVTDRHAIELLQQVPLVDLLYSFGTSHPGAITLHNFPRFLQRFERPDGVVVDLAATDVLRMRELGVPRYNRFRRLFRLRPVPSFEALTDNPAWAAELRRVYGGDLERVDLMTGLFAEPKPAGFGFSDTAFRVFILMASRRLKSDRFFTTDFTPRVYSPAGFAWVQDNDLGSVLLRHFPGLAPALRGVANGFAPWTPASP